MKKICNIKKYIFASAIIVLLCFGMVSYAADDSDEYYNPEDELSQYDFKNVDEVLKGFDKSSDTSFSEMTSLLLRGDFGSFLDLMGKRIINQLTFELEANRSLLWQVVVIAAVSAFFTNFSAAFENGQVGETGFFISYLMLSTLLMTSFLTVYEIAAEIIGFMVEFIMALIPSFYLAVACTGKSMSSMTFYELTVAACGVVEWLFLKVLLPSLKVYIAFVTANNMSKEALLEKLSELMLSAVNWSAKALFGVVIGISVVQNMVLPYADTLKTSVLTKTLSSLPGIGGTIDSAAGLIFGTANLIKNGIGMAALVFIASASLLPVMKILIIYIIMQIITAIIQPVADKRITSSVSGCAEGVKAALTIVFYTAALFMIVIAMVCAFSAPDL